METLDQVWLAFLVVGCLFGAAVLLWIKLEWEALDREFEEDQGWHRMWHERIYEDEASGPGDASTVADDDATE